MKKLWIAVLLLAPFRRLQAQENANAGKDNGTLEVLVKGFKSKDGQLRIAVYNTSETFMGETPYRKNIRNIDAGEELVIFDNLPYGNYAVAVIHDENNDGKLDKNDFGIPTEGYGFSNDSMGRFGPPDWIQASFVLNQKELVKLVDLSYGIPR